MSTDTSTSTIRSKRGLLDPGERRTWIKVGVWALGSLVVIVLLLAATVSIVLNNPRFHSYVLATIQREASKTLGVQVQLQNYSLHPGNLSVDIYGLTVSGASPYTNTPILQLDHASAGIRIVSLLRKRWYLDQVRVDHPVIQVLADANGLTNIPKPKTSGSSNSNTNLFDLGVRHVLLDSGEFFYNDKKAILQADLHNLDFRSGFNPTAESYSGTVSYENGHIQSGTFNPIPHSLEATFDATRTTFHLQEAKLSSGSSQLRLTATAVNYSNPVVEAHYDATVVAGEFQSILKNPSIPLGTIHAKGLLQYHPDAARSVIEMISVDGDLDSNRLSVHLPSIKTEINNIAAHYSLANGNATVDKFRAHLLGGDISGTGTMNNIADNSNTELRANLRGISLADVKGIAASSAASKDIAIKGVLNANAQASWGKSIDNLVAKADATLQGTLSRPVSGTSLPVDGAIHGTYTGGNKIASLQNTFVRFPKSSVTLNGTIGSNSNLAIDLEASDLREVDTLAAIAAAPSQPLGLTGTGSFKGVVHGSTTVPHLTGLLNVANLQVRGTSWRALRASIDASPSFASLQNAVIEPSTRGKINLSASAGLRKWSFSETSPVQIDLTATQMNVADLAKAAGVQAPITGTLSADIKLHGTEVDPVGQGNVTILQAKVQDEAIESAQLTFVSAGDDQVHTKLSVKLAAGSLDGAATIRPRAQTYQAEFSSSGINLNQLQTLKTSNVDAVGLLTLKATGQGSFKNPQVNATLQIPKLLVQNQAINGLVLQATVADHVANATLNSEAINTSIQAKAKVNLTGDYLADASIDTQAIPLQPLVAIYAPAQAAELSGQTELHATLHGPLKNKSLLEAHVTIPLLKLAYSNSIQLAAVSPIHADFVNNIITVQRSSIQGTETNLVFQGSIPTVGNAPVSVLLQGTVNLRIAQLLSPDVRSSGQLRFDINSFGARTDPNVQGQVEVVDASFANGDLPVGLQHGNGILTLTKDRLNITKFEGTVGGGKLTAQGGVTYRPALQFNMGLAARGIRLLYPQGMREGVDADLALSGTPDEALLGGQVRLTELSFSPDFDLTGFVGQFSGGAAAPPPAQGFSQNLRLNIGLISASDINLVSRTLSVGGAANLRVQGTAAQPVILGRVNLSTGDLIINGDRFVLEGGTIQFVNPSETQPVVNVSLNTTIQEYNIHLRFNGPVDQLRTNYASDPALPAADIINLLAFGKTNEAGVADTATPANQAAESAIATQVSSQVTSRLSKIAGISQLSIDPILGGGQTNPGAKITIQQKVTGNLYVTFSSDVTDTQAQVITGQYRLSPRFSISATRDQNGGFALDTQVKKSW